MFVSLVFTKQQPMTSLCPLQVVHIHSATDRDTHYKANVIPNVTYIATYSIWLLGGFKFDNFSEPPNLISYHVCVLIQYRHYVQYVNFECYMCEPLLLNLLRL